MTAALIDDCACAEKRRLLDIPEAERIAASFVTRSCAIETVALHDAPGRILARPLHAGFASPPFDQSAMDGYAFAASSLERGAALDIAGRIEAGGAFSGRLAPGRAARIFTGAPLPAGADTVVMQEHVRVCANAITPMRPIARGANVRLRGEDILPGDALLDAGQRLDARHIALLAAQGVAEAPVVARPRLAVLSCGAELRQPGEALHGGDIYDSNRPMLMTLARRSGLEVVDGGCVGDDPAAIAARLRALSACADMIVLSGGASVGDKDFCAAAIAAAGGRGRALKIAMKPGKPAVVGAVGAAAVLGLPGNPVAALVSWLLLGRAMAQKLTGCETRGPAPLILPSVSAFTQKPGRTTYLPARLLACAGGTVVEILNKGGSARLRPLIAADGFVEIPAAAETLLPGDAVAFLPWD